MAKLKVGIILEDCLPTEGGGYSYYRTMLAAINAYNFHSDIEMVNINLYDHQPGLLPAGKKEILVRKNFLASLVFSFLNLLYRVLHRIFRNNSKVLLAPISKLMDFVNNRAVRQVLRKEQIDLIYYLKPREHLISYPMIVTHWDVGHKSMFPFPEVALEGNFEIKEMYYQQMLSKAFLILCESKAGAAELLYYYPANPARVKVLPLFAGEVIESAEPVDEQQKVFQKYGLSVHNFYLYPAQFWAHKNHFTLLKAFHLLRAGNPNSTVKLVLCGGDQGNLPYVRQIIHSLGLDAHVVIPGFVTNSELYSFYCNAIALVMPTFLGPTNIPLLEAAHLKCAIICSDFDGHREMLGEHALYIEPSCPERICTAMEQLLDPSFRQQLVSAAYQAIINSPFRVEKSIPLLNELLQQVRPIRKAWGSNINFLIAFAKIGFLSLN